MQVWRRWGYDVGVVFSWYGLGPVVVIRGTLNVETYCTILGNNVPVLRG